MGFFEIFNYVAWGFIIGINTTQLIYGFCNFLETRKGNAS